MRQSLLLVSVVLAAIGGFGAGSPASCVPRYSVQVDQSCALCHTNPTGGGQRSLFGAQFFVVARKSVAA